MPNLPKLWHLNNQWTYPTPLGAFGVLTLSVEAQNKEERLVASILTHPYAYK
jgi:hypothetical protein